MTNAFITGSHAYGKPREDSDVDLVVLVDPDTQLTLLEKSDTGKYPIKYGNLNIITIGTKNRFEVWKKGTKELVELKDKGIVLTRQQAIEFFNSLFESEGMSKSEGDSGSDA